uniref:Thioredoxin-like_fold domain-containing protein n=1 Tax=Ascaris lumbricoides TaxID=6252 RepID=A0A0M3I2Y6_ASCLU
MLSAYDIRSLPAMHILIDGRSVVEVPSSLTRVQCTAVPASGVEHGLRVRVVCMQKWSSTRAEIRDAHRYHWIEATDEALRALHFANEQYRPSLYLL